MKYTDIRKINVNAHIEKKNGLSYLSWAWAVDQLLLLDGNASWMYEAPQWFGETLMVFCKVTAFGKTRTAQLPVMDYYNRAIKNPDAYQVNTAMQRCLAKAISLHGIGLYIYAGEDLPVPDKKSTPKEIKSEPLKVEPPHDKITPTSGAMDGFTGEEQELLYVISENITHLTQTDQVIEASHILGSLTNEEKLAVWSQLQSKTRSKLKQSTK